MMLDIRGLAAWYGPAQILFDVSFAVGAGEVLALVGRNGAGKSTTLKAMMGLVGRRAGFIRFDGRDLSRCDTVETVRRGLAYVPEDRRIFTDLTVAENLEVGRRPAAGAAAGWTPERLYDLFPNLAALRHRRGGQMSGGEQQMLAIARALMGNPRLILLDEPSEGLAPRVVEEIARTILLLKREGLGVVVSEQNAHFLGAIADRAVLLDRGRVRFSGTAAQLAAGAADTTDAAP